MHTVMLGQILAKSQCSRSKSPRLRHDWGMYAGRRRPLSCSVASSEEIQLQSEAERFVESLQSAAAGFEEPTAQKAALQAEYNQCKEKVRLYSA